MGKTVARPTTRKQGHSINVQKHLSKSNRQSKLRIGFICGKDFDPVPRGTHDRDYPHRLRCMNNTGPKASGWGGMFQIDVSVALKLARMYPDLIKVDLMKGREVSQARLRRNHVNFNFAYDVVIAQYNHGTARANCIKHMIKNPDCRMWPSYNYYDWVCTKSRYMKQCSKAGIPIIDTIFIDNGIVPEKLIKQVEGKGWDNVFIKSAAYVCFGNAAMSGNTAALTKDMSPLRNFVKENPTVRQFLVQPYMVKRNGNVFDEIRNFFVDGKWAYSVYTDGTDDDAVYEQPKGALKDECKALAVRAFKELLKVSDWHGKPMVPLMSRVDIGFLPDKSSASGYKVFLNELECEVSTWLPRYSSSSVCDTVAKATAKKVVELVKGSVAANSKVCKAESVQHVLDRLEKRITDATS